MKKVLLILVILFYTNTIYAGTYSGGSGTLGDPYIISTTNDLIELSNTLGDWGAHFIQTADIVFNGDETQVDWDGDGTATWDAEDQLGFSPIGNYFDAFSGNYNGNDYSIQNLFIDRRPSYSYVGLFGKTDGASIQHIELNNVEIYGDDFIGGLIGLGLNTTISNSFVTGQINGNEWVGGMIGQINNSTVETCYSQNIQVKAASPVGGFIGRIWSSTVSNCFCSGNVTASGSDVGGFIGVSENNASITNSYSTAIVTGGKNTGGFVGLNDVECTITKCYSVGDVHAGGWDAGGLVGRHSSSSIISQCFSLSTVVGTQYVGGLVGNNLWSSTIENSYAMGKVSGEVSIGGLVGINNGSEITNCYSTGFVKTESDFGFGGLVGAGSNPDDIVSNSFWDTETSGQTASEGGTGKSTLEMKLVSTFTDENTAGLDSAWDFVDNPNDDSNNEDIWELKSSGKTYPMFAWQPSNNLKFNSGSTFNPTLNPNSPNQAFGYFSIQADTLIGNLIGVSVKLNGTRSGCNNFILWQSSDENYDATDTPLDTIVNDPGNNGYLNFSDFLSTISSSSPVHYFLTCDLAEYPTGNLECSIEDNDALTIVNGSLDEELLNATLSSGGTLSVEEKMNHIESYSLNQNYPNPFNPSTTINFTMKKAGLATLKVYDMLGRNVFEKQLQASVGANSVTFDAQNLTSGVYFYQLNTEAFSKTMKMMLVK
jgi:hypothetical protein